MLEYKFLFNCLQLWRSYAILNITQGITHTVYAVVILLLFMLKEMS